jgi:hypothetical protein
MGLATGVFKIINFGLAKTIALSSVLVDYHVMFLPVLEKGLHSY